LSEWTRKRPWYPTDALYGDLPLGARKRIACISRKHGIALNAQVTFDDWLDRLPYDIAAAMID
jgi:hypothetical protein